ncbi:SDR family NAD(P)-dependent oxidoreductase [Paenibacillus sp. GCM10027627]|uniref:SDR family NAD(P)-dependent oxidoreductase n=1 Tax=unclassified Paenibacillus TaxID=185978 RepID=UPI003625CAAE
MRILVTGGTSGIGYGIARLAAERGWEVILVGRDVLRGARIAEELGGQFIQADLSVMSEVRRIAEGVAQPIDALAMCAGGVSLSSSVRFTGEGHETVFATNYLSKFLLSQLLLQQNKIAPGGCIVMVGGNGNYKKAPTAWTQPQAGLKAAFQAALAVDLYASELAVRNPDIRVHTCYPGVVRTNLLRNAPLPFRIVTWLMGSSVSKGSMHVMRLFLEKRTEVHWNKNLPMQFNPPLLGGQEREKLLAYSQQMASLKHEL